MRTVWERGPREVVTSMDRGREVVMRGKNGGPIIRQSVVKRLIPKARRKAT